MNYRDFLQSAERQLRLPWTGGPTVCDHERSYRLRDRPPVPGWYRFRVHGRRAELVGASEPAPEMWRLPQCQGYLSRSSFIDLNGMQGLHLVPRDDPPARYAKPKSKARSARPGRTNAKSPKLKE